MQDGAEEDDGNCVGIEEGWFDIEGVSEDWKLGLADTVGPSEGLCETVTVGCIDG